YSYDINQPYYLLSGVNATITQQVFGPLDVVVRTGRDRLAYRTRAGALVPAPDRTDRVTTSGGGVGFHFGEAVRFGIDVDHQRRRSPVPSHQYDGLRFGTSVTYGS